MFLGSGTHITRDVCFLGGGTHITSDMCFMGGGTHISNGMYSSTPKLRIPRQMGFPYLGTHFPSDMYSNTQETHINSICVPLPGKHISLALLSQVVCDPQTPRLVGGPQLSCQLLSLILLLFEIFLTTLYGDKFESLRLPLALNFIKQAKSTS